MTTTQPLNRLQNIAIVGASGTIGTYILAALLTKPSINITAITRNSSTKFPPSVRTALVDYTNPSTLISALRNQDALIITLSVTAPRSTQATLIRAAAEAGVPWILPNEFGMYNTEQAQNDTIGPGKAQDRELIEELGLSWIGLTCGFWYEHSLTGKELFGFDVKERKVTLFDDGEQKLNCSTWGFVGRAVAGILSLPVGSGDENDKKLTLESYRNRMVFVSSSAVSQRDMWESLQRVTGTREGDWEVTKVPAKKRFEEAREEFKKGNFGMFGRALYTRYFYEDAGLFEKTHGLDNERLSLEKEDLDGATERAVGLVESEYWERYGKS